MADEPTAFPALDPGQIAALDALGTRRAVAEGEYLYREGDTAYDFVVVVSGAVDIVTGSGGTEQLIARHGPGHFLGELAVLRVSPGEISAATSARWR